MACSGVINFKFANKEKAMDNFKRYINKYDCPEITLDLSGLNIIDALKFMILSSTYHYRKYPKGKLKCKTNSADIRNFVESFAVKNLELVN
jgi:hypothetical protein